MLMRVADVVMLACTLAIAASGSALSDSAPASVAVNRLPAALPVDSGGESARIGILGAVRASARLLARTELLGFVGR